MRAVITVAGYDRVGIIAGVTAKLAELNANILDITQTTLLSDYFTMVMLIDADNASVPFADLADAMSALGEQMGLSIRAQREDTFNAMHRI